MLNWRRLSRVMLVVAGFAMPAATSRAVDFRLLPPNAEIILTINVKQILDSELVKSQQQAIQQIKEYTKPFQKLGFDPFQDLIAITIASPGLDVGAFGPFDLFIIMDMAVDPARFSAAARDAAAAIGDVRIRKFGNLEVFEFDAPTKKKIYAALVGGKSLVLTAEEEALKAAIERSKGDQIVAAKVKHHIKAANAKQSLNFALSGAFLGKLVGKIERESGSKESPVTKYLANIEGLSGAVTVTKEIGFQFSATAKDEKSAVEMAAIGRGGLILLNAFVAGQESPELAPLIDIARTLRISSAGTDILLTGQVSAQNLEKIKKSIESRLQ